MNWTQWKTKYQKELQHIAGYEEMFVDRVLSRIPNLQPTDVIPQYHFVDDKGNNRYIDFMIINPSRGWLLPIELDGYAKMVGNGDDYARFQDFLERQNSIIKQYGILLRYTNKDMLKRNWYIINEITQVLLIQLTVSVNDNTTKFKKPIKTSTPNPISKPSPQPIKKKETSVTSNESGLLDDLITLVMLIIKIPVLLFKGIKLVGIHADIALDTALTTTDEWLREACIETLAKNNLAKKGISNPTQEQLKTEINRVTALVANINTKGLETMAKACHKNSPK